MFLKDERVAPDMAELWRSVELDVSSSRWSVELQQCWRDVGLLRLRPQQLYRARRCTGWKGTAVVPAGDHPGLYQQLGGSWVWDGLMLNRYNPHETGRRLRQRGQKSQLTINHDKMHMTPCAFCNTKLCARLLKLAVIIRQRAESIRPSGPVSTQRPQRLEVMLQRLWSQSTQF